TAHELLERLLGELGLEPYRYSRAERVQLWRQHLAELNATEGAAFIAIERADDVDAAVLRALDSLTAADPNGCTGARLVLMGGAALRERLEHPALAGLRQRVRLVDHLRPLDAARVEAY